VCLYELENQVSDQFDTEDGRLVLNGRREKIKSVAKKIKGLEGAIATKIFPNRLCPRTTGSIRAWFSMNQKLIIKANPRKGFNLNVEVRGKNVGEILVQPTGQNPAFIFTPKESLREARESVRWEWSQNSVDAENIRTFLRRQVTKAQTIKAQEREIQWQLSEAIKKGTDTFRNLQPIQWLKYPSEIGVSINREGAVLLGTTGNIDLMVRDRGRTGFYVFELKRPGATETIEKALRQSIYYALALDHEANLNADSQQDYRKVFGSNGSKPLKFGAVAVMSRPESELWNEFQLAARDVAKRYKPSASSRLLSIGILTYHWDPVSMKASDWEWLIRPG